MDEFEWVSKFPLINNVRDKFEYIYQYRKHVNAHLSVQEGVKIRVFSKNNLWKKISVEEAFRAQTLTSVSKATRSNIIPLHFNILPNQDFIQSVFTGTACHGSRAV
jgi:hypothetical protein